MVLLGAIILLFSMNQAFAGKLDDFETDATQETTRENIEEPSRYPDDHHRNGRRGHHEEGNWENHHGRRHWYDYQDEENPLAGLMLLIFFYGGGSSWERMDPSATNIEPRQPGEPALPLVRFDLSYQDVESDVYAVDGRLELGYGPFGLEYRQTRYEESSPDTDLDLIQIHGLYRMTFSKHVELDLGFGAMILDGEDRSSGFSFSCPLRVRFTDMWGVEGKAGWAIIHDNTVSDYDLDVLFTLGYASIHAGYRWVDSGNADLNGPYAGLSLHY